MNFNNRICKRIHMYWEPNFEKRAGSRIKSAGNLTSKSNWCVTWQADLLLVRYWDMDCGTTSMYGSTQQRTPM
eukprot:6812812-Karenia_brevis.AAC.1